MAGGNYWNFRKKLPSHGAHNPQVMAVYYIRFKCGYSGFEFLGKNSFVFVKFIWGEIAKSPAFVRHYIAHAYNLIGDIGLVEFHEHAMVFINVVQFSRLVGLDACDQKVIMIAGSGFSQHTL
jgi:hypothetical protein